MVVRKLVAKYLSTKLTIIWFACTNIEGYFVNTSIIANCYLASYDINDYISNFVTSVTINN